MNLISSEGANIHDGFPKLYLKLTSERTLLQQTALRPSRIAGVTAPIVVMNNEQRFLVDSSFKEPGPGRRPSCSNQSAATPLRTSPGRRSSHCAYPRCTVARAASESRDPERSSRGGREQRVSIFSDRKNQRCRVATGCWCRRFPDTSLCCELSGRGRRSDCERSC